MRGRSMRDVGIHSIRTLETIILLYLWLELEEWHGQEDHIVRVPPHHPEYTISRFHSESRNIIRSGGDEKSHKSNRIRARCCLVWCKWGIFVGLIAHLPFLSPCLYSLFVLWSTAELFCLYTGSLIIPIWLFGEGRTTLTQLVDYGHEEKNLIILWEIKGNFSV